MHFNFIYINYLTPYIYIIIIIVLPVYFKQSKYTSFTRKLKRWGFTRVTSGTELGAYYHKVRLLIVNKTRVGERG